MSRLWFVLRLLFAVGVLAFVFSRVDPGDAADALAEAPWWAFVVPSVLLLVNSGVHAFRIRVLLPEPRPRFAPVLRSVLLGNFFGLFLPSGGGEAAKVVALGRSIGNFEVAVAALALSRVLELVPWGLLCLWGGLVILPGRLPEYVPLALGTAGGFLFVLLLFPVVARVGRHVPLPAFVADRILRVLQFRTSRRAILTCLVATAPFALINCFVVWAILRAYGVALSYPTVLGLIPTLDVIIALPITVSGIGVREVVFVHGLGAWDVAPAVAIAASLTRWTGELFRSGLGGLLFLFHKEPASGVG